MNNIKIKAFSLVEMLVALLIISIMTAAMAPVISKKLTQSYDPNCIGGLKHASVAFEDVGEHEFVIPDNIAGIVTVTMVGAGGGGGGGMEVQNQSFVLEESAPENFISFDNYVFPAKAKLLMVSAGEGVITPCTANGHAGCSYGPVDIADFEKGIGLRYNNVEGTYKFQIRRGKNSSVFARVSSVGSDNSCPIGVSQGNDVSVLPTIQIPVSTGGFFGVGAVCNAYFGRIESTQQEGAARIVYSNMIPAAGGGGGSYSRFDLGLKAGNLVTVNIGNGGRGGIGGVNAESGGAGEATQITAGANAYTILGGKGGSCCSSNPVGGDAGQAGEAPSGTSVTIQGLQGSIPVDTNSIVGGTGGNSASSTGVAQLMTSFGGTGGCFGATRAKECGNASGKGGVDGYYNGITVVGGTGGGGGSCDNRGCGKGGDGGKGYVRLDYNLFCN